MEREWRDYTDRVYFGIVLVAFVCCYLGVGKPLVVGELLAIAIPTLVSSFLSHLSGFPLPVQ